MSRILLTWEAGSNFGHAAKIARIAAELDGHELIIASRDIVTMRRFLEDQPATLLPAPMPPDLRAVRAGVNFSDNLRKIGFNAPEVLGPLYDSWRALFDLVAPDLIVCQSSPTALLAAQTQGAPVVNVGTSHDIPPMTTPLPPFQHWRKDMAERAAAGEAEILEIVNTVLRVRGLPEFDAMTDLFWADKTILATIEEMDHYPPHLREGQGQPYTGPLYTVDTGARLEWEKPTGRIFAYLRPRSPAGKEITAALGAFGQDCDVVLASPGLDAKIGAALQSQGVRWVDGAVALDGFLEQAALCISHASFGVVAAAMHAGVPQVTLPNHAEQLMIGHAVARNKVGLALSPETPVEAFQTVLRQALGDAPMRRAAAALGTRLRQGQAEPAHRLIARQIETCLREEHAPGG